MPGHAHERFRSLQAHLADESPPSHAHVVPQIWDVIAQQGGELRAGLCPCCLAHRHEGVEALLQVAVPVRWKGALLPCLAHMSALAISCGIFVVIFHLLQCCTDGGLEKGCLCKLSQVQDIVANSNTDPPSSGTRAGPGKHAIRQVLQGEVSGLTVLDERFG